MKGKKLRIINSEFAETIKSKQLKGSNWQKTKIVTEC